MLMKIQRNVRSLQCPPNSCRNLVIPAESSGFQRNELWQEGLLFLSFRCLIIPAEFMHSGIETRMFCRMHRNGMHRNPVVWRMYNVWHRLFVCCTPVTKQIQSSFPSTTTTIISAAASVRARPPWARRTLTTTTTTTIRHHSTTATDYLPTPNGDDHHKQALARPMEGGNVATRRR